MKTLKLQIGNTYRNREGKEVKIVEKDGAMYPFKGDNGAWYAESGRFDYSTEDPHDLIEEVPSETTRHTFDIPDGVKKVTVEQVGNRIVVEMVPEEGLKPGDVCINDNGSVYIFKAAHCDGWHNHFAWLGESGRLLLAGRCQPGRHATPEESKLLFDALKKAGKRWNAEAMQVEDVPEIDHIREWVEANTEYGYYNHEEVPESDRILEWVEEHLNDGHYNQEGIAEVIGHYLKYREGEK